MKFITLIAILPFAIPLAMTAKSTRPGSPAGLNAPPVAREGAAVVDEAEAAEEPGIDNRQRNAYRAFNEKAVNQPNVK